MGGMGRDFRRAKKSWTGAGKEPEDALNGVGAWQSLHEQRLKTCPEWDGHVQMGCASMGKFGGGHTGESTIPDSESEGDSDTTEPTTPDAEVGTNPTPDGARAKKRREKGSKRGQNLHQMWKFLRLSPKNAKNAKIRKNVRRTATSWQAATRTCQETPQQWRQPRRKKKQIGC